LSTRPTPIKPLGFAVFLLNVIQEICTLSEPNGTLSCIRGLANIFTDFLEILPEHEPACDAVTLLIT